MHDQEGHFRKLVPRTLRFDVVESIRAAILDGTLASGSPLVEARVAEEMGISRAPVREGLRKLEDEGLVVSIPYKGTYVTRVRTETILEIASLRTLLESFAVELAMPRLAAEGVDRMKTMLSQMREAAAEGNVGHLVEIHMNFHRLPYELSNHSLLLQCWNIMEGQLRLYLRMNLLIFGSIEEVADSHEEFVRLLESGAGAEALKSHMADHIQHAAHKLVRPDRKPAGQDQEPRPRRRQEMAK